MSSSLLLVDESTGEVWKTPFHTSYGPRRPTTNQEELSSVSLVERVGYISANERINQLRLSGEKLVLARAAQFDFDVELTEEMENGFSVNPTTRYNFDFAEAFALREQLKYNFTVRRQKKDEQSDKDSNNSDTIVDSSLSDPSTTSNVTVDSDVK